jgi:hypothetical protein
MSSNSKLRESVESLLDLLEDEGMNEEILLIAAENRCHRESLHIDKKLEVLRKAKAALAEPLHNCDVGTVEEQTERYDEFCRTNFTPGDLCGDNCILCPLSPYYCKFQWAQLPYEGNESEADNENNEKK